MMQYNINGNITLFIYQQLGKHIVYTDCCEIEGEDVGSVMWQDAFCQNGLGPLKGSVTANEYKLILIDHFYPIMKTLCPNGSGVFQDDNVTGYEGSLTGLMSIKMT